MEPATLNKNNDLAAQAWRLMGSKIDWAAMPLVFEYIGVINPETVIRSLEQIKSYTDAKGAASGKS